MNFTHFGVWLLAVGGWIGRVGLGRHWNEEGQKTRWNILPEGCNVTTPDDRLQRYYSRRIVEWPKKSASRMTNGGPADKGKSGVPLHRNSAVTATAKSHASAVTSILTWCRGIYTIYI